MMTRALYVSSFPQIDEVGPILAVVVHDLAAVPELAENRVAQKPAYFFLRILPVQSVGADQPYVASVDACLKALLDDEGDGNLPMRVRLRSSLNSVGEGR